MNNKTVQWGIIGCGDVAEVKSGPAFNKIPHSTLVAVMRRNGAKAKDFAKRHQVKQWYDDADELLHNPEINAVYIATPPSSHAEYALKAIKAGKNIYLEKPLARSSREGREISKALAGTSVKLTVAHYRRKMPAFLQVEELLKSKGIGEVRLIDIQILQSSKADIIASASDNWRINPEISGGGYFYDLAPHQIDLMLSWFGVPAKVKGFGVNQQGVYPANDLVNGIMKFKDNIQFRGVWAFNVSESDKLDRCTIYGNKGSITFSFFGDQVFLTTPEKTDNFTFQPLPHVQQPMIEATVQYFLGASENPCSLEDAILGMEVMEAMAKVEV